MCVLNFSIYFVLTPLTPVCTLNTLT
uniref:Uncharacterized protein n=1 Tax=Anguilla anguilla TaxID=7936 RepID=A0A0E9UQA2_ANGAN